MTDADQIIYLNHGRIIESGTHAQLLAHNNHYADLYRSGDAAQPSMQRSQQQRAGAEHVPTPTSR